MPHIMIVDDDPDTLVLLSTITRSLGYEVSAVESGEAAITATSEQEFDLVLLDQHMSGISGIDTAKILHQQRIPFLFCTSITEDEVLRHAMAQGALNYIIKPFTPAKVIFAIASSLRLIEEQKQNSLTQIATGILMERCQTQREDAFKRLEKKAQGSEVTIDIAARQLIDELSK